MILVCVENIAIGNTLALVMTKYETLCTLKLPVLKHGEIVRLLVIAGEIYAIFDN